VHCESQSSTFYIGVECNVDRQSVQLQPLGPTSPAEMASSAPLLSGTIEADEDVPSTTPSGNIGSGNTGRRDPVVLVPGTQSGGSGGNPEEGGIVSESLRCLAVRGLHMLTSRRLGY
jgi:hypothetical protein